MEQRVIERGLEALRHAIAEVLRAELADLSWLAESGARPVLASPLLAGPAPIGSAQVGTGVPYRRLGDGRLYSAAAGSRPTVLANGGDRDGNGFGDSALAASSAGEESERARLIALVELARGGDKEAFGQLYDHYHVSVFRFLYYRVSSTTLAEDLTAETFFRALRSMNSFRWQGKDFGAWLMTIARNLATDHFKAGRTRLEQTTEDIRTLDSATAGPEGEVLASLTNEALIAALADLPNEQRDCLVMRFLEGLSIAETAEILGRSAGAVKQLQLRGVRNLAKMLPRELLT